MRKLFSAAVFVLAAGALAASAAPITYTELLSRPRPAATVDFSYGREPGQYGELFLPRGNGPHSVVVMIHGGCWMASLPGVELMDYIAGDLQARGFAVWNIEYRRLGAPAGGYPGTFQDVAHGIDALRQLAPKYQLDLKRVVVVGHSAGGHLALWAAARSRLPKTSALYQSDPLPIAGVVSLSGIGDLQASRGGGDACGGSDTIDAIVGAASPSHPDVYADTSPASLVPIGVKQIVVTGSLDRLVPAIFAHGYADKATAAGDDVQLLEISGAGHFELIDPASQAWQRIAPAIAALAK
ncbi:MAG TPA: alpha/beta hydrolase [Rhizomicrobium sp.]|nr:alpha/beta hydrolase [Rhizomicrobium sp.]